MGFKPRLVYSIVVLVIQCDSLNHKIKSGFESKLLFVWPELFAFNKPNTYLDSKAHSIRLRSQSLHQKKFSFIFLSLLKDFIYYGNSVFHESIALNILQTTEFRSQTHCNFTRLRLCGAHQVCFLFHSLSRLFQSKTLLWVVQSVASLKMFWKP